MSFDGVSIGMRIREHREMRGLTRDSFADMVNISPKFIYEIEYGRKGFSARTLFSISEALCTSCDYILFGIDGGTPSRFQYLLSTSQVKEIISILKEVYGVD